jgi:hypothetical protein
MTKWFELKSWSFIDYALLGIFILSSAYIIWAIRTGREGYAEFDLQKRNHYAKNKASCAYPAGYHRYQSNLCDPQQDQLPITMPNPNAALPPPVVSKEAEMLLGVMNGPSCGCADACNCSGECRCAKYEKINLCQ